MRAAARPCAAAVRLPPLPPPPAAAAPALETPPRPSLPSQPPPLRLRTSAAALPPGPGLALRRLLASVASSRSPQSLPSPPQLQQPRHLPGLRPACWQLPTPAPPPLSEHAEQMRSPQPPPPPPQLQSRRAEARRRQRVPGSVPPTAPLAALLPPFVSALRSPQPPHWPLSESVPPCHDAPSVRCASRCCSSRWRWQRQRLQRCRSQLPAMERARPAAHGARPASPRSGGSARRRSGPCLWMRVPRLARW